MIAQYRVASPDRVGQFQLGAADFGGTDWVDIEVQPAQAEDVGIAGRLTVGIGMIGLYGRYMHFMDVMTNEDVVQIGLAIKLPLWTSGGH